MGTGYAHYCLLLVVKYRANLAREEEEEEIDG